MSINGGQDQSFERVLKALLNKYIVWVFVGMAFYVIVIVMVLGLSWAGFWSSANLKITIYWFVSSAIVTVFRSTQETSNPNYFRQTLRDNMNVVVLLEYIANFHSFNILAELAIFPVVAILVAVQAFSEEKEEYKSIQNPLNAVLAIYLLSLLIYSVYRAVADPLEYATADALSEFLLPPMLSIAFLPFMFLILTYLSYEQAFLSIRFSMPDELLSDARRISFLRFRGDRLLLLRWGKIISCTGINSRSELIKSIDEAKYMKWREEHPSIVTFERGWAPRNAADYLSSLGIVAGDYSPSIDGIWTASADYFPLVDGSPVLCNNIAYYIYGDSESALQLKLKLNVNEPDLAETAHGAFLEFCDALAAQALNRLLGPAIRNAILVGKSRHVTIRGREVTVERHDWVGNIVKAYEMKFEIRHPDFDAQ